MVAQDLENGVEFIEGLPKLRPIAVHRIGGRLDCLTRTIVGPPQSYRVWYCGQRQAQVILQRDLPQSRTLLYSAEGGGKSVLGAQWLLWGIVLDVLAGVPGPTGRPVMQLVTAPVREKLQVAIEKLGQLAPIDSVKAPKAGSWGTFYADRGVIEMPCGHRIKLVATKKQSAATGSPVQGFSAKRSWDEELQDTAENGADPDIEARLRGFKRTERLATATAKDSPGWRTFRDGKLKSKNWRIERIRFDENCFEWPSRWETMKAEVSEREWQRRGLAMDVGPERMVYVAWNREKNLRPVPQIGAVDVTRTELAAYGPNIDVLVGHDPGKLCDVSVFLKAYRLPGSPLTHWWVVDELTTNQTTTEQHVDVLVKRLRERWGCHKLDLRNRPLDGSPVALIRADPYGDSDAKPDRSIYTVFRQAGLDIRPAAYSAVRQNAATAPKPGRIDRDARIEVVNHLLCAANGARRLFVDCDERQQPVAPRLLEAIELSEREEGTGKAEVYRKGRSSDLSHWPSALGYALWSVEKPRMGHIAGLG